MTSFTPTLANTYLRAAPASTVPAAVIRLLMLVLSKLSRSAGHHQAPGKLSFRISHNLPQQAQEAIEDERTKLRARNLSTRWREMETKELEIKKPKVRDPNTR